MSLIPKCIICNKENVILTKSIIGGTFLEACEECITKYNGKKLKVIEVDNLIKHTDLIRVFNIGD